MWNKLKQMWLLGDRLALLTRKLESDIEQLYRKHQQSKSYIELTNYDFVQLQSEYLEFNDKQFERCLSDAIHNLYKLGYRYCKIKEGGILARI